MGRILASKGQSYTDQLQNGFVASSQSPTSVAELANLTAEIHTLPPAEPTDATIDQIWKKPPATTEATTDHIWEKLSRLICMDSCGGHGADGLITNIPVIDYDDDHCVGQGYTGFDNVCDFSYTTIFTYFKCYNERPDMYTSFIDKYPILNNPDSYDFYDDITGTWSSPCDTTNIRPSMCVRRQQLSNSNSN